MYRIKSYYLLYETKTNKFFPYNIIEHNKMNKIRKNNYMLFL